MAIRKLEYKECTKCGGRFPATTEYFHGEKTRKDGLYPQCKHCKNQSNKLSKQRGKEKKKKKLKPVPETPKKSIEKDIRGFLKSLKEKYPEGKGVEISSKNEKLYGRVTGHYEHFMTVKTNLYPTSVLYVDMLTGDVKVK